MPQKIKYRQPGNYGDLLALFGLSCSFVNTIVFACGHLMLQLCQFYAYCTVFESIKLLI